VSGVPSQPLPDIELPGRAGELQRAGKVEELAAEVGTNYAQYHAFLAKRMQALGGRARPEGFPGDHGAYLQACQERVTLVRREGWLRWCKARVAGGVDPARRQPPLLDERGRLVSDA